MVYAHLKTQWITHVINFMGMQNLLLWFNLSACLSVIPASKSTCFIIVFNPLSLFLVSPLASLDWYSAEVVLMKWWRDHDEGLALYMIIAIWFISLLMLLVYEIVNIFLGSNSHQLWTTLTFPTQLRRLASEPVFQIVSEDMKIYKCIFLYKNLSKWDN